MARALKEETTDAAPVRGLSLDEIETPASATGPKRLADRRANDCAFPLDDPGPNRMDQTMFCCERVSPDSPYCPKHSLIVWPHGRPKRAAARRTAA